MNRPNTNNGRSQSADHHAEKQASLSAVAVRDPIARALRKLAEALSAGLSVSIHQAPSAGKIELACSDTWRTKILKNPYSRAIIENENGELKITHASLHKKRSGAENDNEELFDHSDPEDDPDTLPQKKRRPKHQRQNRRSDGF
jgi:hypothetical protein